MQLVRFDPDKAIAIEGGDKAHYVPIQSGERLTAMLLKLGRKGDTGKRELQADVMLVVISGEGKVRSGGEIADMKAGDVAVLTGGLMHHIWTADSEMEAIMSVLGTSSVT